MKHLRYLRGGLLLVVLLLISSSPVWSRAQAGSALRTAQAEASIIKLYLPLAMKPSAPPLLPAEVVGTWFTGTIPPTDFYDPTTGRWRDTNGLGQMYIFTADGGYTYAGFLRLQNGQCRSEVSVYKRGTARATAGRLTLTPSIAKTRTVIVCGSRSETVTEGPFDPYTIGWRVEFDDGGRPTLWMQEGDQTTEYGKQGMVDALVGAWHRGAVVSTNFYDPVTQTFGPQNGEGAWYRFNADGTYSFGEFGFRQDPQGCTLSGWVYQTGTVEVSGGTLTTKPTSGVARVENACKPGQPQQQPYVEAARSYVWFFRDLTTDRKLVLIPLANFEEFVFTRE